MLVAQRSRTSFQPRRGGMSEPIVSAAKLRIPVSHYATAAELHLLFANVFYKRVAATQLGSHSMHPYKHVAAPQLCLLRL
jgi:hypothetical protein